MIVSVWSLPATLSLRSTLVVALLVWLAIPLSAQQTDLKKLNKKPRIEIPFSLVNDFIVINVLVDNVIPTRFIVDTGAENTVLLEKRMTDLLDIDYRKTYNIRGSDLETLLTAYLATGIDLRLADALLARDRSMLVLAENYFNFERIIGQNIQGILGADFLMRFVVEINYRRGVLILHDPAKWSPSSRHKLIKSAFVRNRPYVQLPVTLNSSTVNDLDLPVQTIPTFIANGLGGQLQGSVGRARSVGLAGKELEGVVTYFQPIDTSGASYLNEREGILGNRIMKRFNVVVDYLRREVWFRPEGKWRQRFRFDRSGLSLLAGGRELRTFNVAAIAPGSPAERAGLRVGDRLSLSAIIRKLEGKVGRRIKIKYYRDGQFFNTEFRLEDLI